jgi:predicted metal-binding membrane protein
MNVVWMAALGILMTVEKMTVTNRLTYAIGVVAIAAGMILIAAAMIAHWPAGAN